MVRHLIPTVLGAVVLAAPLTAQRRTHDCWAQVWFPKQRMYAVGLLQLGLQRQQPRQQPHHAR